MGRVHAMQSAPVCSKRCLICKVPPPPFRAEEHPRTRASAVASPLFVKGACSEHAPSAHAVVRVRTRTSTPTPSQHASKTRWCVCIRQCLRVQALGSCALPGKGIAMRARAGEGIAKGRQGGILPVPTARSEAALPPRPVKSTCPPVATAPMRPCLPWKAWQHREVPNRRLMQGPPNPITGRILWAATVQFLFPDRHSFFFDRALLKRLIKKMGEHGGFGSLGG